MLYYFRFVKVKSKVKSRKSFFKYTTNIFVCNNTLKYYFIIFV
nr:MAG TPA: hypothetical protein [Caudoviricetes sp.]